MKDETLIERTVDQMLDAGMSLSEGKTEITKKLIARSLERNRGNLCHAALPLRVHRNTLNRNVEELGIRELRLRCRQDAREESELRRRQFALGLKKTRPPRSDAAMQDDSRVA